jgi:microcystin-dependent protein
MFAASFPPAGWMFCNGDLLPISENETLFQIIGTTYGGDGQSTFALPNLQSRVPLHMGMGNDGINYQLAEAGGVESVTLSTQQMPTHTHPALANSTNASLPDPGGNVTAKSITANVDLYLEDDPSQSLAANAISPVGGSQPHENLQPYLTVSFIISLFGLYPSPT